MFGRGSVARQNSPGLFGTFVGGPAVYPDPNAERWVKEAFSGNGSVYTIVSRAASKFGSIPRYVYKIKDKNADRQLKALYKQRGYKLQQVLDLQKKAYDEQLVENALSELLARPNPMHGQDAFYELAKVYKMVTGEAFIWLNRGDITGMTDDQADAEQPLEMYVLPTQFIEIIPDPADVWSGIGYYFQVAGERHFIRWNDMIHWKSPNPNFDAIARTHMRGLSPLQPGNKWVTEDDSATDAAVAMQQNDGAKGVLFNKMMGNMSPEQKSKIDQLVNRKINNRSLKGAVTAMEGDWGYAAMGQTGQEMELVDVRSAGFKRLCNLFGVPPQIFDTESTFNNVESAGKSFINNLIAPAAASLRDEMNLKLLPAFGLDKTYTHDIDISQLPELQTEMKDLVDTLFKAWWMTGNEKRAAQNLEQDTANPNMDKYMIPNNLIDIDDATMADTLDSFTNDPGANNDPAGQAIPDIPKKRSGAGN